MKQKPTAPIQSLPFRKDGSFTIAQFTDIHLTDGNVLDQQSCALMDAVLQQEKPDLVIFTGDLIAGTNIPVLDAARAWRMAVDVVQRHGMPWAAVFGNHDDEGNLTRTQLMAMQRCLPGCLSQAGPRELPGVGNYLLDLRANDGSIATRLYLLDSLSYGPKNVSRYAWISAAQIAWFKAQAQDAPTANGLVFFHIPLPEYEQVWHAGQCRGNRLEAVCCPKINSGMFAAMVESGKVAGVFVGHDHVNDYEGTLQGIRLCYGRAGGYGSYGDDALARGARLIRVVENQPGFSSWIRLEDGTRLEHGAA